MPKQETINSSGDSRWCGKLGFLFVLAACALASVFPSSGQAADDPLLAFSGRVAGDDHRARVVIEFDRKPDIAVHYVDSPPRIVVDLQKTAFALPKDALAARGLFDGIRYGTMGPGRSRIVLESKSPMKLDLQKVTANTGTPGYRLVLDATAVSADEFAALVRARQPWEQREQAVQPSVPALPQTDHPFTVVLDPGHGGIDSGAVGITGTLEKNVTLAFAKALQADLLGHDIHVVMTRTDDEFVSLGNRVKIGQQNRADLFISIHANSISINSIRGATVYTLSNKASDRLSQRIAEDENGADSAAGLSPSDEPPAVAGILMDLTRRETSVFSVGLADKIVSSFDGNIRLISNPHRVAGFRVLEAPDVPSVLVELGYLSNRADEKLLNTPAWREKVAGLLTKSILKFRATVLASRN